MEETLISFETAKLAEEKGYKLDKWFNYIEVVINLPTQSLLQKWLREVHNIHVNCIPNFKTTWFQYHLGIVFKNDKQQVGMIVIKEKPSTVINKLFDTYEEALETGLMEALKLI